MHHMHAAGPAEAARPHTEPLTPRPITVPGQERTEPVVPPRNIRLAGPWELERAPAACRQARAAVRRVLADWELDGLTDTAELLVSELVTNAVIHAEGPLHLTVEQRYAFRCQVDDGSSRLPRVRGSSPHDEYGRGLELVSLMAGDWGVDRTAWGKRVWFELPTAPVGPHHRDHG